MFHDADLFEQCMALRCEVKSLRQSIKEFQSGKRYLKLQADHHRVIEGYIKEIKRLKRELGGAHAQAISTRDTWSGIIMRCMTKSRKRSGRRMKRSAALKMKYGN